MSRSSFSNWRSASTSSTRLQAALPRLLAAAAAFGRRSVRSNRGSKSCDSSASPRNSSSLSRCSSSRSLIVREKPLKSIGSISPHPVKLRTIADSARHSTSRAKTGRLSNPLGAGASLVSPRRQRLLCHRAVDRREYRQQRGSDDIGVHPGAKQGAPRSSGNFDVGHRLGGASLAPGVVLVRQYIERQRHRFDHGLDGPGSLTVPGL